MNRSRWIQLLGIALAIVVLITLSRSVASRAPDLAHWVEASGSWAPLVFGLLYILGTVLFVPGSLLTLAAGALFGVVEGTLVVWISAMLGSGTAFLIARYGARSWIEKRIAGHERFAAIDRAVAENGLKITFLLRMSPVFPFSFLNYALGLTRMGFRDYLLAGFGMLPDTLLYVYYGSAIGTVAQIATQGQAPRDSAYYVVMALGLVATILVTTFVTRIARRALAEATGSEQETRHVA